MILWKNRLENSRFFSSKSISRRSREVFARSAQEAKAPLVQDSRVLELQEKYGLFCSLVVEWPPIKRGKQQFYTTGIHGQTWANQVIYIYYDKCPSRRMKLWLSQFKFSFHNSDLPSRSSCNKMFVWVTRFRIKYLFFSDYGIFVPIDLQQQHLHQCFLGGPGIFWIELSLSQSYMKRHLEHKI